MLQKLHFSFFPADEDEANVQLYENPVPENDFLGGIFTMEKVSCSVKGKLIKLKISQLKIPQLLVICGCQHSEQPLNCNRDPLHKYS